MAKNLYLMLQRLMMKPSTNLWKFNGYWGMVLGNEMGLPDNQLARKLGLG